MTELNKETKGEVAHPGMGRRRAITAAMVTVAMLSAQAAFAGYAGAQDCPTCPTPTPSPNPPAPSPGPIPPAPSPGPPAPAPNAAPVITPLSPKIGSKTSDTTPLIKARIRDDSGELAARNIKLFVDGKRKSFRYVAGARDLLSASPKLSRGRHTVKIVATDSLGKSATKSWRFTIIKRR